METKEIEKRLVEISGGFLGYPYIKQTIIPSPDEAGEHFDGFDCMTFVEVSLALALSSSIEEYKRNILAIRYYDSIPAPAYRKHFAYADWLRSNSWLLKEKNGFEGATATIIKVINRKAFFDSKNIKIPPFLKPVEEVAISYIPVAMLLTLVSEIYVVLFVSGRDDLDVEHMGFCVRKGRDYILRHASSKKGKVVEESFLDYLYSADCIGIVLAGPIVETNIEKV